MASKLEQFIALSVVLTDFDEFELHGTGQAEEYCSTVQKIVGQDTMNELLQMFSEIQLAAEGETRQLNKLLRLHLLSDEKLGPIARNIIKLWYAGVWYQLPYAWREKFGVMENDVTFIPSPNAYIEGLLWPAIGSHPAGAKAPGYGSWGAAPHIPKTR